MEKYYSIGERNSVTALLESMRINTIFYTDEERDLSKVKWEKNFLSVESIGNCCRWEQIYSFDSRK
jgi:hypothetical protein